MYIYKSTTHFKIFSSHIYLLDSSENNKTQIVLFQDGELIVENRRCAQCRQKIPRSEIFYNSKSNPQCDLCQNCFIKGGHAENMFNLAAYEPGKL